VIPIPEHQCAEIALDVSAELRSTGGSILKTYPVSFTTG
jgi:hypothetical protein